MAKNRNRVIFSLKSWCEIFITQDFLIGLLEPVKSDIVLTKVDIDKIIKFLDGRYVVIPKLAKSQKCLLAGTPFLDDLTFFKNYYYCDEFPVF